jgi:hypothetical protein
MKGADKKKLHHLLYFTLDDSNSLSRNNLFQKPFYALNSIVMQCSHGAKIKPIPKQPYERKYGNSNKD